MKLILMVLLLTGCATSQHYHPYKHGDGYKEVQLAPNMFRVSYEGGNSAIEAADYTMLRAAEVTLEKGFSHFMITREKAGEQSSFSLDNYYFRYGSRFVQSSETHATVTIVASYEDGPELFDAAYVVKHFRESYQLD